MYMYGSRLPKNEKGLIDNGLGKAVAFGKIGILAPTITVHQEKQMLTLDGVRFVFHNASGTEAPSEFTFYLPDFKAYCGAELMGHTLHNLYTLRGAKVRDATKWASVLNDALRHVQNSDVVFNQHHWPVWGQERAATFVADQRDMYRYLHDQTLRLMNHGLTPREIAAELIDMGLHLGIGGVATFPKAGVVDVLRETGLDRVVLETDSPYLAPVPFRGKRNESAYLRRVAEHLAAELGIPLAEVANVTTRNARHIFGL
jgi:hypothetical protein